MGANLLPTPAHQYVWVKCKYQLWLQAQGDAIRAHCALFLGDEEEQLEAYNSF